MKLMNQSTVVSPPKHATERLETGAKQEYCNQVRKCSQFEKDGCSNIKLTPCTPCFAPPPSGFIIISDEDDMNNLECTSLEHIYEGDMDGFTSAKRKRSFIMIASDDEGDKDGVKGAKRKTSFNLVTSDDEGDMDGLKSAKRKTSSNLVTSDDEGDMDGFKSAKRKTFFNLVTSDDEGDMDGFKSSKRKTSFNYLVTSDDEGDMDGVKGAKRKISFNLVTSDDEGDMDGFKSSKRKTSFNYLVTSDDEGDIDGLKSAKRKTSFNLVTSDDKGDMDGFKGAKRKTSFNLVTSDDEGDMDGLKCAKRKTSFNLITSDDEGDMAGLKCARRKTSFNLITSDDEVTEVVSRRPLRRLGKLNDITIDLNKTGNSSSEDEEDDESLGGFIVENSESGSESEAESESGDVLNDYIVTLDMIRRKKDLNLKWGLEGDMLANFGKDPEWCMRAVCALYRQQTADEKEKKGTFHQNGRGFSQTDAFRASCLAEFLTDGDPDGGLKKTVEELERYDPKGIELCKALAAKYSKQLFRIYQKKEDPYFMP